MVEGLLKRAALVIAALFFLAGVPAAASSGFAPGSTCQIYLGPNQPLADAARDPGQWNCRKSGWRLEQGDAVIRFDRLLR